MESPLSPPIPEAALRAPFQTSTPMARLSTPHLIPAASGQPYWRSDWRKVVAALQQPICSPAHRWFFCYHLVPTIGQSLSTLLTDPLSALAKATEAFLTVLDAKLSVPGASRLFTDLRPLVQVDRPPAAPPSVPTTSTWWQPLPSPVLSVEARLALTPVAARRYMARFSPGPCRGDCVPWGIVVLILFLHGVTITVKEFRAAAAVLLGHGLSPDDSAIVAVSPGYFP